MKYGSIRGRIAACSNIERDTAIESEREDEMGREVELCAAEINCNTRPASVNGEAGRSIRKLSVMSN